ncbi:MAG TPA: Ig-like domain-containing protein [Verrucomicrobiae bacterium]|nr:Ig-like domain-containing protein [Verrucomicrobiae bacterium]
MKTSALIPAVILFCSISIHVHAQESPTDFEVELQALEQTTPLPASQLPENATIFYSAAHPEWPPLPGDYLNLPFWVIGNGVVVIDDVNYDYAAVSAAAQAKALSSSQFNRNDFNPDFLLSPSNLGFQISQQSTNIVLQWMSGTNRLYLIEDRPTLTSDSYWNEFENYILSPSHTNLTSIILTNQIQAQPMDFFRLIDVTPIAANDYFSIDQDSSDNQLDIFDNDTDPNGDRFYIANLVAAHHGDISYSLDATTFQYTPESGYYGIDTFQYNITSGYGEVSSNATVKVFVNKTGNNQPVATAIIISLPTNTFTTNFNGLANVTDADNDTLSIYAFNTLPTLGTVTNDLSGNITYTRNSNLYGKDTFSYIVTDGNGGFCECSVVINQDDLDADNMPDQWELKYGLNTATDDSANDPDGDGLPNLAEFILGTNPNAPDNPLNLSVVTNGMEFSDFVHIPLIGVKQSIQNLPVILLINGEPAANSVVSQAADGTWQIDWDTTFLTNGNYDIQLQFNYNGEADITSGQTGVCYGQVKTISINNPITYDKITSTFGNQLFIEGTLADTN